MNVWKNASGIFHGGTQQIKSFSGRRVKVRTNLSSVRLFDPIGHTQKNINLKFGTIGFISKPHPQFLDELLIAFPNTSNKVFQNLNSLIKNGNFFVVQVNSPTFKQQFDIEI